MISLCNTLYSYITLTSSAVKPGQIYAKQIHEFGHFGICSYCIMAQQCGMGEVTGSIGLEADC